MEVAVGVVAVERPRSNHLPHTFEVSHGEVDGCQAGVDTTSRSNPDGTVDVQRGAKKLALLLRLCFYSVLGDTGMSDRYLSGATKDMLTLLEESLSEVVQALTRASWELLKLSNKGTDCCRHL